MKAFILEADLDHVDDSDVDISIIPFEGYQRLRYYFLDPYTYEADLIPNEIICVANFGALDLDFLVSDFHIPIISARLLDILESTGEFKHMAVPLVLIDNRYPPETWFMNDGINHSIRSHKRFYALRINEHLDIFDFDNSEYSPSRRNPRIPRRVSKFAIHDLAEGLPPIFRVASIPSELMISQASKESLEKEGIIGVRFKSVHVTPYSKDYPA